MAAGQESSATSRLKLTGEDLERRRRLVDLGKDDLERIAGIRPIVAGLVDVLTEEFFSVVVRGGAVALLANAGALSEAKRMKREHLVAMASGVYDQAYAQQRLDMGHLYSRTGVDVQTFLGAFHQMMRKLGHEIMTQSARDPMNAFQAFTSLKKVGFMDIGLIVDGLIDQRERTIAAQQEAIRDLSTPVLQVRDRLLILPIIGVLDSQRAKQLTDSLLHAIRSNRAKVVVMDITGVAAVDSKVANHLIQTIAAARLMGTGVIVTGLTADVAQALVALGVDLSKVNTVGDLQGGIEEAERLLGYKVMLDREATSQLKLV